DSGLVCPQGRGGSDLPLGRCLRQDPDGEGRVVEVAARAARRFGLKDRGLLREGPAADVVDFDPAAVRGRATFGDGRRLAEGMEDVILNGELVLHAGKRTDARPGDALRRA